MSFATALVVGHNLDPDLALETARANGFETPVSVGTYRRQLREAGLNRAQRRSKKAVHRRFEAEAPGEIFQCDVSGVKDRFVDVRNRRVLYVSEADVNAGHPNRNTTRVKLWKITIKDDHSRYLYTRFFAAEHENSCIIVDFLLQAFRSLGVPLALYTDNASTFRSRLTQRAASILNRGFADHGGFKFEFGKPHNPNARGKVESSHLLVEKFEKLISLGELAGEVPTVEALNRFAERICDRYNWTKHRETNEKPEIRFRAGHGIMRVAPPELLNDAFKAREVSVVVNADVTISIDAVKWQLPRGPQISATITGAKDVANPFIDLAASSVPRKIDVIWPVEAEWFVASTGGNEFTLAKVKAVADMAGEHKSVAESAAVKNKKHFTARAADLKKAAKAGDVKIVRPGFEKDFEIAAEARPAMMPRREVNPSLAEWANTTPGVAATIGDQLITYVAAAKLLQQEEVLSNPLTLPDQQWLKSLFHGRDQVPESELRAAITARTNIPRLAEVKSA
jgi:transposase InsO family protein